MLCTRVIRGWSGRAAVQPRRHRRGSTATAADTTSEERCSSMTPSSSEDELPDPATPVSAAAAAVNPRAQLQDPVFHYTGDRERDAVKTERRRAPGGWPVPQVSA